MEIDYNNGEEEGERAGRPVRACGCLVIEDSLSSPVSVTGL